LLPAKRQQVLQPGSGILPNSHRPSFSRSAVRHARGGCPVWFRKNREK
jgi:hypothetical protein